MADEVSREAVATLAYGILTRMERLENRASSLEADLADFRREVNEMRRDIRRLAGLSAEQLPS
jgi:phage shock protein A